MERERENEIVQTFNYSVLSNLCCKTVWDLKFQPCTLGIVKWSITNEVLLYILNRESSSTYI